MLRIYFADFPYTTLIYASETAHLGHLMRFKYGHYRGLVTKIRAWLFKVGPGYQGYPKNWDTL